MTMMKRQERKIQLNSRAILGSGVSLVLMRSAKGFELDFGDFAMDFGEFEAENSSVSTFSDLQMSEVRFANPVDSYETVEP